MTELLLMRHGETEENLRHILQGHLPGHLTERGREQARETARTLCPTPPQAIVSSDLQRCRDTAGIVLQTLREAYDQDAAARPLTPTHASCPLPSSILFTPLLRERNWGSATGATVDSAHRVTIPEDAETVAALRRRAEAFLRFAAGSYPGQRVLVVSHGLFLRFLQATKRGVDIREVTPMANGEIRTLRCH